MKTVVVKTVIVIDGIEAHVIRQADFSDSIEDMLNDEMLENDSNKEIIEYLLECDTIGEIFS